MTSNATLRPLILVRHGHAAYSGDASLTHFGNGRTGGWTDSDLTDRGREQATLLAARLAVELAEVDLDLVTSDLKRAHQTATIIGDALGITPRTERALREHNNGVAAGMTRAEADAILQPLSGNPLDWRPYPEAETWREFYERVARFLEAFTASQQRPALLVAHAGTLNNAVAWWLGLGPDVGERPWVGFEFHPTSVSLLRTNDAGERSLERLNDTAHLLAAGMFPPLPL